MWNLLLLAADIRNIQRTWFLLPLIIVVSLVYSASRYESPQRIITRALRMGLTILGFMGAVFVILILLQWGL
jgi:hypothetical protein